MAAVKYPKLGQKSTPTRRGKMRHWLDKNAPNRVPYTNVLGMTGDEDDSRYAYLNPTDERWHATTLEDAYQRGASGSNIIALIGSRVPPNLIDIGGSRAIAGYVHMATNGRHIRRSRVIGRRSRVRPMHMLLEHDSEEATYAIQDQHGYWVASRLGHAMGAVESGQEDKVARIVEDTATPTRTPTIKEVLSSDYAQIPKVGDRVSVTVKREAEESVSDLVTRSLRAFSGLKKAVVPGSVIQFTRDVDGHSYTYIAIFESNVWHTTSHREDYVPKRLNTANMLEVLADPNTRAIKVATEWTSV